MPEGTRSHEVVTDGGEGFSVDGNRQGTPAAVALGDWKIGRVVCV